MTADHTSEATDEMLRTFLRAQRESVLAIVEGLSEEAWHRSVVPTGWTPAGMLEHLGGAEWHWFQGVVAGKQPELPDDLDEDRPPYDPMSVVFTSDASSAEVTTFYRDQCAASEAVLATTPLSASPRGKHGAIRAARCSLGRAAHDQRRRHDTLGTWTLRGNCSMARSGWVVADGYQTAGSRARPDDGADWLERMPGPNSQTYEWNVPQRATSMCRSWQATI